MTHANGTNDNRFDAMAKALNEAGSMEGYGLAGRPLMAHTVLRAAAAGVISTAKAEIKGNPDDAGKSYSAFLDGRNAATGEPREDEKVGKAQLSKVRAIIKLGVMPAMRTGNDDAPYTIADNWFADAGTAIKQYNAASGAGTGTYEGTVHLARKQVDAFKSDDKHLLTVEEMVEQLQPAAKDEKTNAAKLLEIQKRLATMNDGTEVTAGLNEPAIAAAIADLQRAIEEVTASDDERRVEAMNDEDRALEAEKIKAQIEAQTARLNMVIKPVVEEKAATAATLKASAEREAEAATIN